MRNNIFKINVADVEQVSPRTNRPPKMTSTLTFHRISNYLFRNKGVHFFFIIYIERNTVQPLKGS